LRDRLVTPLTRSGLGTQSKATSPLLVFFYSSRSGASRRVEGYLSQVLQRRQNHDTFRVHRVASEDRPELVERFGIEELPAIVVLDNSAVSARLEGPRTVSDIETVLAPWLR
jgi:thioredoxin-like negative regulator of GroEL